MLTWSLRPPRYLAAVGALALLGLAVPGTARADFVAPITYNGNGDAGLALTVTYNNFGSPITYTNGWVGEYSMSFNGGPNFNSFCVDLNTSMTPGTTYSVNQSTIPSTIAGSPAGNYMAFLANSYLAPNNIGANAAATFLGLTPNTQNNNLAEAAVQTAVWALEYNNGSVTGAVTVTAPSNVTQTQFNTYVSDFITEAEQNGGSSVATVYVAQTSTGQSQMGSGTGTPPVPEPASVVLWGMGLFGFGAYGWRKRSRLALA